MPSRVSAQYTTAPGLPVGPFTVTVVNPQYKSQVIACHLNITEADAAELMAIYRALGHADRFVYLEREEAVA